MFRSRAADVDKDKEAARLVVLAMGDGPLTDVSDKHAVGLDNGDQAQNSRPPNRVDGEFAEDRAVGRLPRAVPLPPVSGLRPVAEGSRSRDEQFINGIRVPPSLALDHLRPPMWKRRDNLRMPLAVLLASAMAIPIAYYFLIGGFAPTSEPEREAGLASIAPRWRATTRLSRPEISCSMRK